MILKEFTMSPCLQDLLQQSSAKHSHLCPRQVLGVRMGLTSLAALGLDSPIKKHTALIIVETDGCFADGIEVSTGATVGHRSLRINDFGKIAATFANINTGRVIRISPNLDVRQRAQSYVSSEKNHYTAQLLGYQAMPDGELFRIQPVILQPSLDAIISRPVVRVNCDQCGEEIINERQVHLNNLILCRACAHEGYYLPETYTNTYSMLGYQPQIKSKEMVI
jgi:formylmethanofuran dehydrogenase subunit E